MSNDVDDMIDILAGISQRLSAAGFTMAEQFGNCDMAERLAVAMEIIDNVAWAFAERESEEDE